MTQNRQRPECHACFLAQASLALDDPVIRVILRAVGVERLVESQYQPRPSLMETEAVDAYDDRAGAADSPAVVPTTVPPIDVASVPSILAVLMTLVSRLAGMSWIAVVTVLDPGASVGMARDDIECRSRPARLRDDRR